MYRVLIVDDEPIHVRGLTNMIRSLRPDYYISDASNGEEAFEHIKCNHVDILFTDVKMPIIDGLQLIESTKAYNKEIKIVILSAYGYFEYAQKAIRCGAFDYILKPVNGEKVDEILKKVDGKIKEEHKGRNESTKLRIQLNNALPEYYEHNLNKLIFGVISIHEFEEMCKQFPLSDRGVVIVLQFNSHNEFNEDPGNIEVKGKIKKMIGESLNSLGKTIVFFLQDETYRVVSILEINDKIDYLKKECTEIFNDLLRSIRENFQMDVTIGVGTVYKNPFNEAKVSFKHGKTALEYGFYIGYDKAIYYDELNIIRHEQLIPDNETDLTNSVLNMDKALAIDIMEDIFDILLKDGYPKPQQLINGIAGLLKNQIKTIMIRFKSHISKKLEADININLFQCNSLKELKGLTYRIIEDLIDELAETKSCKNPIIIEEIKKYIHQHYMEDLSLDSVAKLFYFNPAYLSNLFKTSTQVNFSQYVNEIRICKAREMLKDANNKVYEISRMVGYRDAKYFIKIFKKECGMTPNEYRYFSKRE
ncbi:response regulator transcription factor [Alkaliphilus peptidifermentans]|uniref:Stage 0 sporulation protein A homolog n=1 Tax=Alkaliphilus peptidifermentans DSM 18978 TaxID=1120976 RepID=A0A1G5IT79_9FIRM|nr:response regulator [Alkaliphilus peptidifermentans]SCY79305.1 two-component system, response regulator YesN [Alkaliphilus peptidifermentans DSM 18978]